MRAKCDISYPVSWTAARESLKSADGNCFIPVSSSALFYFVFLFWLPNLTKQKEQNLFKSRKGTPAIICHNPMKLPLHFLNITLKNVTVVVPKGKSRDKKGHKAEIFNKEKNQIAWNQETLKFSIPPIWVMARSSMSKVNMKNFWITLLSKTDL